MKDDKLELVGTVVKEERGGKYVVSFDDGHTALCHVAGRLTKNRVRIIPGDRVVAALSVFDLTKGILTWRNE